MRCYLQHLQGIQPFRPFDAPKSACMSTSQLSLCRKQNISRPPMANPWPGYMQPLFCTACKASCASSRSRCGNEGMSSSHSISPMTQRPHLFHIASPQILRPKAPSRTPCHNERNAWIASQQNMAEAAENRGGHRFLLELRSMAKGLSMFRGSKKY